MSFGNWPHSYKCIWYMLSSLSMSQPCHTGDLTQVLGIWTLFHGVATKLALWIWRANAEAQNGQALGFTPLIEAKVILAHRPFGRCQISPYWHLFYVVVHTENTQRPHIFKWSQRSLHSLPGLSYILETFLFFSKLFSNGSALPFFRKAGT